MAVPALCVDDTVFGIDGHAPEVQAWVRIVRVGAGMSLNQSAKSEYVTEARKMRILRDAIDIGLKQAMRNEFSSRSVLEIAADVLAEGCAT